MKTLLNGNRRICTSVGERRIKQIALRREQLRTIGIRIRENNGERE